MTETITPPIINRASLETTCPDCNGNGEVENPAWNGFDHKLRTEEDARLFTQKHGPESTDCPRCRGLRVVPTEMLRDLIEALTVHAPFLVG